MPITTIPFSARKAGPYTATAGQTEFSFGFPVLAAADLTVWRERAGVVTQLLITTHYTVNGVGEQSGGAVVLTSGAEEADIIAIDGTLEPERANSFVGGTPFKTSFIDTDLNRLAIMVQELAREIGRSIRRAAVDENAGSLQLPRNVTENTLLALTAAGELIGLAAADIQGGPGDPGPTGTSILSSSGPPGDEDGNEGDFYIDLVAYELYGPKTAGAWGAGASLVGPPGAGSGDVTGPAGATAGHAAVFSGSSGKIIASAGFPPANADELVIGDDIQAHGDRLDEIAALGPTKGNLIAGNGSAFVAVGVGANGTVLAADSAQAAGVAWTAPAAGWEEIESGTASGVANFDIPLGGYDIVEIWLYARPATNNVVLQSRLSQNNGASFLSGAADYAWGAMFGSSDSGSNAETFMQVSNSADGIGNAAGQGLWTVFRLDKPNANGIAKVMHWQGGYFGAGIGPAPLSGSGQLLANTDDITDVRFFFDTGNVAEARWFALGRNSV